MKGRKQKTIALFFCSLLSLILVSSSFSSPQIEKIEDLKIVAIPENGEYRITISFLLGYTFDKARRVLENLELYPHWAFSGINELGLKRFAQLTQSNFHYVSKDAKESLLFDYDVRIFFFHFTDTIDISLQKSIDPDEIEGEIKGFDGRPGRYVKEIRGALNFKKTADGKTLFTGNLLVRPAPLVYRVIPHETLKRVVKTRLTKICENLSKEVFSKSNT